MVVTERKDKVRALIETESLAGPNKIGVRREQGGQTIRAGKRRRWLPA